MGHEYDRNKPPYAVDSAVFTQGWYLIHAGGDRPNMGLYVALIALQIKAGPQRRRKHLECLGGHAINRLHQISGSIPVSRRHVNVIGSGFGKHQAHAFALILPALPGFRHLLPEVGGIEGKAVKQELRADVLAAVTAHVPPYAKPGLAAAGRAPLKRKRRVKRMPARKTAATALSQHLQLAMTAWAIVPRQHHGVIESPDAADQPFDRGRHAERHLDDVQSGITSAAGVVGFWFFGVNLRPQALHLRSLRGPSVLVFRTPLLTVLEDLQYGQLCGLPRPMRSPRETHERPEYLRLVVLGEARQHRYGMRLGPAADWSLRVECASSGTMHPQSFRAAFA